jgi:cytochrome c553
MLFIALATLGPVGSAQAGDVTRGAELFDLCAQCHGADGGGNQAFLAPSIAAMDSWYVESQLKKFKSGVRGTHPEDVGGLRMYPMSLALRSDDDINDVAAYLASLPAATPEPVLEGGDATRGKALFGPCTACHGADAAGNQQLNSGPLRYSSDWYLLSSLQKYKSGLRGAKAGDVEGALMRPMASILADEQAMKDVIAYIMTLRGQQ